MVITSSESASRKWQRLFYTLTLRRKQDTRDPISSRQFSHYANGRFITLLNLVTVWDKNNN